MQPWYREMLGAIQEGRFQLSPPTPLLNLAEKLGVIFFQVGSLLNRPAEEG